MSSEMFEAHLHDFTKIIHELDKLVKDKVPQLSGGMHFVDGFISGSLIRCSWTV